MNIRSTIRPAASTHQPQQQNDGLKELWRDHGINPGAMAKRLFVERPLEDGAPLQNSTPANPLVIDSLESRMGRVLEGSMELETLQSQLKSFAEDYGLQLNLETGIPQVNWDSTRPGMLDYKHTGGPSAYHELVHVFQCLIGGAAALGTAAATKYKEQNGASPESMDQLKPIMKSFSAEEKSAAFESMVEPMETQAYSTFEEAAFYATGFMGKRSKNRDMFRERLGETVKAYTQAYETATVPVLEANLESRIYGQVGHLARTNGETALVLGAGAFGYYHLAKQAMKVHPLMAVPVASPLVYVLYRALVSG